MGRSKFAALPGFVVLILCVLVPSAGAQTVEPRIVGGDLTPIEKYPWQAAVVVTPAKASGSAYARQFCGGSLITPSIVLTAAHCLYDDDPDCDPTGSADVCLPEDPEGDGSKRVDRDDIDVVLGAVKLKTAPAEDEHAVEGVVIDPDFDPGSFQNDIGYLILSAPVELSGTVQTIDLAGGDEAAVWAPGTLVEVSGWGSTEYGGNTVNALRGATVPIVADSTCGSALYYGTAFDPATMVCAGFAEGGVDSCNGDSGGPLESPLEGGGYRLVGIVSWGFRCAEPNSPGVYTRIAQAGPGGLRDEVVNTVTDLETTYALTPEGIVGSGGEPLVRPTEPPPPKTVDPTPPPQTSPTPPVKRSSKLAKCRKLKDKRKRKKCVRRAKQSTASP